MPYIERVVRAGPTIEVKKCYTGRVHTDGAERSPNRERTSAAQARVNERKAEEQLRWKINANFRKGDYHLVLHYYDKTVELEQAERDKKEFLRLLRKECKRRGLEWKYIACTETKRMTNVHHHILLPQMDVTMLAEIWSKVAGEKVGNISVKPLDSRGNHAKLAHYLMKESRSTMRRCAEQGKRGKRFSCSKGLIIPKPTYRMVQARTWTKDPKAKKGYVLWKDEDGAVTRSGVHELTGWPWMEYTQIWSGSGSPPA